MSHNINTYIGRQAAWHGLGTVTGEFMTWADILAHGGLDFYVFKSQLHDGRGELVKAWGTFRWDLKDKAAGATDKAQFLGVVGEDYKVIQHASGFEIVDALVRSADGAHYETAGVLGTGEVVWGLADLNLSTHVGHDETKHFLLFHTSHDGSYSYEFRDCATRVVCNNTLNVALSEKTKNRFRVRHTKNAVNRVIEVKDALNGYRGDLQTFEQKMQFLSERRVTREACDQIFDRLFPKRTKDDGETPVNSTRRDNILSEILSLYEYNDNDAFPEQRGTAYNLLNAITEYTDHTRGGTTERTKSAMFGSGDRLKVNALDAILKAADDLPPMRGMQPGIVVDFAQLGLNVPGVTA